MYSNKPPLYPPIGSCPHITPSPRSPLPVVRAPANHAQVSSLTGHGPMDLWVTPAPATHKLERPFGQNLTAISMWSLWRNQRVCSSFHASTYIRGNSYTLLISDRHWNNIHNKLIKISAFFSPNFKFLWLVFHDHTYDVSLSWWSELSSLIICWLTSLDGVSLNSLKLTPVFKFRKHEGFFATMNN